MSDENYLREFNETLQAIVNYIFLCNPEYKDWYREDERQGVVFQRLTDDLRKTYEFDLIHTEGGFEGAGEEHWLVFKFKDRYVKLPAFYNSYDGAEYYWDDIFEVKAVPTMITVYEKL